MTSGAPFISWIRICSVCQGAPCVCLSWLITSPHPAMPSARLSAPRPPAYPPIRRISLGAPPRRAPASPSGRRSPRRALPWRPPAPARTLPSAPPPPAPTLPASPPPPPPAPRAPSSAHGVDCKEGRRDSIELGAEHALYEVSTSLALGEGPTPAIACRNASGFLNFL